ncbi:Stp1/IreP family PP2C-type Ser/Thr phosphatase [Bacillus badius]|uniref:Protein serine/threonine phosphatase PrpC, regulation of stationary phase n=1 Tax=Bacillus badius TaxID=1455 RepID=A0ABR5B0L6_BACBA|nr:Stp1/IreP family PP2C-type Ser/Thr phosphatase [Bacillus badius]KIL73519.1 Protein serine/threonine phosphatase PrpC [Bacillus badius]KIL80528.1 Protein serine/threonine phosphatase PrpC, regulation of stationary phase [Bacillus badius]KZO01623.1 protein phosphatase [Bacillus badius]KZR57334.1 protein phosphatase [Bacillus badius]MED0667272.1 Stp1/IreP family PP2C-type Ser/Thr phosphatase [Bacillus badius]
MDSVFRTDKGRIRPHNEDNGGVFLNAAGDRLAIVADGMGGHNAGDIASHMAIETMRSLWTAVEAIETASQAESWLKTAILQSNEKVLAHAKDVPECSGMGTTLVAAICTASFCTIANIGDSRGYLFNESGFTQVTEDHSLVNELVKSGEITKEDAEHHPRKNVLTRALGTERDIMADYYTVMFEQGDALLLCSDGLSNKLAQQEMQRILEAELSIEEKAESLIRMANENGGEDNITLVILEHSAGLESR